MTKETWIKVERRAAAERTPRPRPLTLPCPYCGKALENDEKAIHEHIHSTHQDGR